MKIRRYKPVPKDTPAPGKKCGAPRRGIHKGKTCKQPAGARTKHLGVGRCSRHGGNATVKHGWYSAITHARIAGVLDELGKMEMNVMDLVPEANLLRAMTIDFVNQYDEFVEALLAWYADPAANQRPRKIMDISDASHLIESISRIVHRMHQIQSEGSISLDTFRRVTEHMGIIVAQHVPDPVVLNAIETAWMDLALDTKAAPSAPAPIE